MNTTGLQKVPVTSPLGILELWGTGEMLTGLYFVEKQNETAKNIPDWSVPVAALSPHDSSLSPAIVCTLEQLDEYFKGLRMRFDIPLDMSCGTAFQQEVWTGLQHIPYGKTVSYRELADSIGHPRAARAVGNANHHNPLSIIVPCHRVITSAGKLGGYGGGFWRKQALLNLESHSH